MTWHFRISSGFCRINEISRRRQQPGRGDPQVEHATGYHAGMLYIKATCVKASYDGTGMVWGHNDVKTQEQEVRQGEWMKKLKSEARERESSPTIL